MIFHICFDFSYAAIVEWDELLICESMVSFETETIGIFVAEQNAPITQFEDISKKAQ